MRNGRATETENWTYFGSFICGTIGCRVSFAGALYCWVWWSVTHPVLYLWLLAHVTASPNAETLREWQRVRWQLPVLVGHKCVRCGHLQGEKKSPSTYTVPASEPPGPANHFHGTLWKPKPCVPALCSLFVGSAAPALPTACAPPGRTCATAVNAGGCVALGTPVMAAVSAPLQRWAVRVASARCGGRRLVGRLVSIEFSWQCRVPRTLCDTHF